MGVKCEKLYSENRREFIRQALKIVPGWYGLSEFLDVLNSGDCLLLGTDSLQKTVVKSCSAPEEEEREIMHEEKAEQT